MQKSTKAWFILLLVKIILATFIPLFADEAYYWVWSKNLQLSYYDHPGMIAWLFSLGAPFDNFYQASRIPGVLLGHLTIWIWFLLIRKYIAPENHILYLMGLSLIPLSGMGALIMTPDLPLIFFWSLSLWLFRRALEESKLTWYLLLGASLGLGFCAKYHIVLFPLAAILYVHFDKRWPSVSWRYLCGSLGAFIVFSAPTWYWNVANDFASFRFQLGHGLGGERSSLIWPLRYAWDQVLLIFPPILFLALRRRAQPNITWLKYFTWTPLIFFFLTSFRRPVEANWPSVAYPAIFSMAFILAATNLRWIRFTVGVWLTLFSLLISQLAFKWIPSSDLTKKMDETYKYRAILSAVNEDLPIFTSTYQMASLLSFSLKKPIYKLYNVGRRDFFDYLPDAKPKAREFYWAANSITPLPEWAVTEGYKIVEQKTIHDGLILYTVRAQ